MSLRGAIPHCSGKCFRFDFSSIFYLLFAAAVKKVHLPLPVVSMGGLHIAYKPGVSTYSPDFPSGQFSSLFIYPTIFALST